MSPIMHMEPSDKTSRMYEVLPHKKSAINDSVRYLLREMFQVHVQAQVVGQTHEPHHKNGGYYVEITPIHELADQLLEKLDPHMPLYLFVAHQGGIYEVMTYSQMLPAETVRLTDFAKSEVQDLFRNWFS